MKTIRKLLTLIAVTGFIVSPTAAIADASHQSTSPPFWTFAAPPPDGKTSLVRAPNGLTAQFQTAGLTAGHAVTMWIMFFDNPEACTTPWACNPDIDIGRPGVRFDFHYASGHIVNGHKTTLTGYLRSGELSTSGWTELVAIGAAPPFFVTPLTNPLGAQVILALHSHGPAQQGATLVEQMNSILKYLGNISTEIERIREKET